MTITRASGGDHACTAWLRAQTFALSILLALSGCGLNRQNAAQWERSQDEPAALSIMSFNVLVGGQPADAVLDAIAEASPDLVCLQEVTGEFAGRFDRRFAAAYPYRVFAPEPYVQGIGIASRQPLADATLLDLDLPYLPALAATVFAEGQPVLVACVHFVTPFARFDQTASLRDRYYHHRMMRTVQAQALLGHIDMMDMPAIILGDMNEWEGQAALTVLAEAGFRNACSTKGSHCAATWPGAAIYGPAVIRIDHILGRGVEFRQAAVLNSGGSDHFPVVARFTVRTTRQALEATR